MAGRILPVALAVVSGVAIGISTFDGEFKELRKKRLEEDYKKEVAAVSALNSEGPSPTATSAISPPSSEQTQIQSKKEEEVEPKASGYGWLSMLGFGAWKGHGSPAVPAKEASEKTSPPEAAQKR